MNEADFFSAVCERLRAALEQQQHSELRLNQFMSPDRLRDSVQLTPSVEGHHDLATSLAQIDTYLAHAVKTNHPLFSNQLWSKTHLLSQIAEMIVAVSNTSMFTYEVAPLATLIEKHLVQRLCQLIGFNQGSGLMTTGASQSNLLAMLQARQRFCPTANQHGIYQTKQIPVVIVSADAHYSLLKAARICGLGEENLIVIPTDAAGRMLTAEVKAAIDACQDSGRQPIMICATAGTTIKGAIDPIDSLATLAKAHGIWLHVDAALGGVLLFHPQLRELLQGIAHADSVAFDAHKILGMNLICSFYLVQQTQHFQADFYSAAGDDYIFSDDAHLGAEENIGPLSLQCGRRVDALKLWLTWHYEGDRGFAQQIDRLLAAKQFARDIITEHPHLSIVSCAETFNLCFQYRHPTQPQNDQINFAIRKALLRLSLVMVNYAKIDNQMVIRQVFAHADITPKQIEEFFAYILMMGFILSHEIDIEQSTPDLYAALCSHYPEFVTCQLSNDIATLDNSQLCRIFSRYFHPQQASVSSQANEQPLTC